MMNQSNSLVLIQFKSVLNQVEVELTGSAPCGTNVRERGERFIKLKNIISILDSCKTSLEDSLKELEEKLKIDFMNNCISQLEINNRKIFTRNTVYPKVEDFPRFYKYAKEEHPELFKEKLDQTALNSFIKELSESKELLDPDREYAPGLKGFIKTSMVVSSPKGASIIIQEGK